MTSAPVPAAPPAFNATPITENLIVGGGVAGPDEMAWLVGQGVSDVLSAAGELDDTALCLPEGVGFFHLAWADDGQRKPADDFLAALAYVLARQAKVLAGGKLAGLYVHCAAGVNRGPLLATFLLAALSGLPGDEAWTRLSAVRTQANAWNVPAYRASALDVLNTLRPFRLDPAGAPAAAPSVDPAPASKGRGGKGEVAGDQPVRPLALGDAGTVAEA